MNAAPVFSSETWPHRLIATLLWALMAAGFGSAGWLFGVRPIAVTIQNWQLAQQYRAVDARIVSRKVRAPDGSSDDVVAAMYEIDSKTYYTERLTAADDAAYDEPDNLRVAKALLPIANGTAVTKVWVSPADPKAAMASRDFPERTVVRRASIAIAYSLLALVGAVGALGALGNFGYFRRFHRHKRGWVITVVICAVVFPLRRLFVDADAGLYDDLLDFVVFLEIIAFLFIFVAIKILFEREEDVAKPVAKKQPARAEMPVRAQRKKKR